MRPIYSRSTLQSDWSCIDRATAPPAPPINMDPPGPAATVTRPPRKPVSVGVFADFFARLGPVLIRV